MNTGKPIAVIGDIHGCLIELKELYNLIIQYADEIYSAGDLIDRGDYSKEVVQFCMDKNIKPVLGNHKDMMFRAIENPDGKDQGYFITNYKLWMDNGGKTTMNSYTGDTEKKNLKKLKQSLKDEGHYDFLKSLPLTRELDTVIISHGGIVKGEPKENVLWNRALPSKLKKLQVSGHTPYPKVLKRKNHYIVHP